MPFLLLQTFAWMVLAGLLGAIAGCFARRLFGYRTTDSGELATAAAVGGAAAAVVAKRTPMVEAGKAPAPLTPVAAARPAQGSTAYTYPVTTVGIPRGNPELVQPQIETIKLQTPAPTPTAAAVVPEAVAAVAKAPSAAQVIIRQAATAMPAAPASSGTIAPYDYPITTIGIPKGYVAQVQTAVATTPAVTVAAAVDAPKVVRTVPAEAAQPRPEPLRPELSRAPPPAPAAPVVAAVVAPAAPAPIVSTPAAPLGPIAPAPSAPGAAVAKPAAAAASAVTGQPAEQPFVPVAVGGAALDALAARAAAAQVAAAATAVGTAAAATAGLAALVPNAAGGAAAVPVGGDDLMRIRTIDAVMQARLKSAGVTKFADIARWAPGDVARVSQALGVVGRIEQENWIEQAQILATGGETDYSRRRARGEIATGTTVATAGATAAPVAPAAPAGGAGGGGAGAAATAAAAAMASAAIVRATATVEPSMPAKLVDAIRENLVKPAAAAAAAPTPVASPAEAPRVSRPDLAGLRSVRSEALRDVTASESLRGGSARAAGSIEDLKRIRGIGVLIEKKLNSLGVTGYDQIANWTNADIDRVSQILDFKGRIERENWVEQARILATGGQTEFSKRVDRGEA